MPSAATVWGASTSDWDHFDLVLGLGADLLPVVSNPTAQISAQSKIKDIGKTPSRYNKAGKVVGITDWTAKQASFQEITLWASKPDYGICLQTREVRAFDIDVPDPQASKTLVDFINNFLMRHLPTRQRPNSGKTLLAFRLSGEIAKRTIPVQGGVIEFLGTGNQFIAVGTHPSGVRYDWAGGLPYEIPELSLIEFEEVWAELIMIYATGEPTGSELSARKKGDNVVAPDPVADFLEAEGLILGTDRDGSLIVACPWSADHTTGEAGDSSTMWFRAGTKGYERGHFKCLHGHCQGKADGDFFAAVGYVEPADTFEPVVLDAAEMLEVQNAGPILRKGRGGYLATVDNVTKALRYPLYCGMHIRFDQFRDEIMYAAPSKISELGIPANAQWLPLTDADYTRLRITLEKKKFKPVARELIRDTVLLVAMDNPFDSAIEWLNQQHWDGINRVDMFLSTYFGVPDSPYARAVSRYLWTAMAGRVMQPGVKADMVPILMGAQGARKSTAVKDMVPDEAFFTELSFDEKDDDLARKMRGRLVAEIGELRGLHTKELESIKAFITRTHENWIPKYREFATKFPRRLVFVGTTNEEEFLADRTGNRRWLPVKVGDCIDTDGIRRDRLQLWAEAADLFALLGVEYRDAEDLARNVHQEHMMTDPWSEAVQAWLDMVDPMTGLTARARNYLQIGEVLQDALGIEAKHVGKREEIRMGKVLHALGFVRRQIRTGSTRGRFYVAA